MQLFGTVDRLLIAHQTRGLTQEDLAEAMGCTRSHVSHLLSGGRELANDYGLSLMDSMPRTPIACALMHRANSASTHFGFHWRNEVLPSQKSRGVELASVAMSAAVGAGMAEIEKALDDEKWDDDEADRACAALEQGKAAIDRLQHEIRRRADHDRQLHTGHHHPHSRRRFDPAHAARP